MMNPYLENVRERLRLAWNRRKHNQPIEARARDFDKWSRYAEREGHQFWREHFADLARQERAKKIP